MFKLSENTSDSSAKLVAWTPPLHLLECVCVSDAAVLTLRFREPVSETCKAAFFPAQVLFDEKSTLSSISNLHTLALAPMF